MNKFLKHLPKALIAMVTGAVIATSFSATALANFGPDRSTKAWSPTVSGFDHVTFDSFTGVGNGIGDERDFFKGLQVGRDSTWSNPVNNVTQGADVEAKIYIHNNADATLNDAPGSPGIAHNVTVQVVMPNGLKQTQDIRANISARNAMPQQIFDTLEITGANNNQFGLQYENGTAQLHEQDGSTTNLTAAQETALTGSGFNLGDQKGCFQFVQEITFKMKVQTPSYSILKQVGVPGQSSATFTKSMNVKPGDTMAWLLTFKNTGTTTLDNVDIVDQVPVGLTVVPGTVKLISGSQPNGFTFPDSAIQANGRQINVEIGGYAPGIFAYVTYHTTVNSDASVACGASELVNKVFATPVGFGTITDTANAEVNKQCQTPPTTPPTTPPATPVALVNTGPGSLIGLFSGVTIGGALLHRLFLSRRLANRGL